MKLKKIGKGLIILVLMILMVATGMVLGNYNGYTRGYHDGQKVTNTWWINKQSRYYDSVERGLYTMQASTSSRVNTISRWMKDSGL